MPIRVGSRRGLLLDAPLLLLDRVPNAAVAYGLRRLVQGYRGAAIRIRRSSDSAEMDIGFSGNELDVVGLLKFVGNSNGVIRTWYDQSGNGKHAAQGGVGTPPTLVASGVLNTLNGKPTGVFDGGNVLFAAALSVSQPFTQYAVAAPGNTVAHIMLGGNTSANGFFTESSRLRMNNGVALTSLAVVNTNLCHVLSGVQNGASSVVSVNGAYNIGATSFTGLVGTEVGSWQVGQIPYLGQMSELLIFNGAHDLGLRNLIETSMMGVYGITRSENFVFDGDSLTIGTGSTGGQSYPNQFMAAIGGSHFSLNDGVGGQKLDDMDAAAVSSIDATAYPTARTTLVIWGGTNDLSAGRTPAQTYNFLKTYVTNRKATGKYDRIVVMTSVPREGNTAERFAYNDLIRAGMQPGGDLRVLGADVLCDLQTLSIFDEPNDVNNATYYDLDRIHLTNAAYAQVAGLAKTTLGL